MKAGSMVAMLLAAVLSSSVCLPHVLAQEKQGKAQELAADRKTAGGAEEMARTLQDPLANIAALMTDNDVLYFSGMDDVAFSFQFQPVYSIDFPDMGFSFIPRGIIPVGAVLPDSTGPKLGEMRPDGGGGRVWGMGDITTQFFFAPKTDSAWKFGFGPQFSWETRTDSMLGGPGFGAGPVFVLTGDLTEDLSFSGIVGNLWSYDGKFNTFSLQPSVYYNVKSIPGAYLAYNGAITANWRAKTDDTWNVPVGMIAGKTFDLGDGYGLDLSVGGYAYPIRPSGSADWSVKFGVTLLFPR